MTAQPPSGDPRSGADNAEPVTSVPGPSRAPYPPPPTPTTGPPTAPDDSVWRRPESTSPEEPEATGERPTAPAPPAEGDGAGGAGHANAEPANPSAASQGRAPDGEQIPIPMPPVSRAPLGSAFGYPARYAHAPGQGRFQFALPQLGTIVAGPAIGSMVCGIAAVVVAILVGCAGLANNTMITVAVTVLAVFFASAGALLAAVAFRQIRRGAGEYRGRGMAITGLACGMSALLLVLLLLAVALLI